jgi:hypothetical protein
MTKKTIETMFMNMFKVKAAASNLINKDMNNSLFNNFDLICLQEPWIDSLGNVRTNHRYHLIYPSSKTMDKVPTRAIILINKRIPPKEWTQTEIQNMNKMVVIQLRGDHGQLTIINIYNNGTHNQTLHALQRFLVTQEQTHICDKPNHILLGGDFNCHHLLWDDTNNNRLFTSSALEKVQLLIES